MGEKMNFAIVRRAIKFFAISVLTLLVGILIYAEFASSDFSIRCVTGDYDYGCNVPNLNVVLVTIIAYIVAIIFILRWKSK